MYTQVAAQEHSPRASLHASPYLANQCSRVHAEWNPVPSGGAIPYSELRRSQHKQLLLGRGQGGLRESTADLDSHCFRACRCFL